MPTTLTILMGCLFVVIGRWLYKHPRKLAPASFSGNAVFLNDVGRFVGILMTFVGASAALFAMSDRFLPAALAMPLVLGLSSVLTWLCFRSKGKADVR